MTPAQLRALARYCDVLRIRDTLNLTPRQRRVFDDRYLHDMSQVQIADDLNVSLSTVAHESIAINRKLKLLGYDMRIDK